jgi:hypothetical protein
MAWPIILNLLSGSLLGAWLGAGYATRLSSTALRRVIAVLLAGIAIILLAAHEPASAAKPLFDGPALVAAGVISGFAIGVVAALLGGADAFDMLDRPVAQRLDRLT